MKTIIKFLFTLLILFAFSCSQETTLDPLSTDFEAGSLKGVSAKSSTKTTVDIWDLVNTPPPPPFEPVVVGSSTLNRKANGITVNFKCTGLTPGYTYTLWWVIWNNADECATPGACLDTDFPEPGSADNVVGVEVLYAAGHVVGNNGKGNFSAHLKVDDTSGSINSELFGIISVGGLQSGNTLGAEVHAVLRSHGPAVPGMINEQIDSYDGGCDNPFAFPPFSETPDAEGECGDIYAAIYAPVN